MVLQNGKLLTRFAPAERVSGEVLGQQSRYFETLADAEFLHQLVDAMPDVFLILNGQRQIVFANRAMLDLIGADSYSAVCGLRVGEVLDCVHAFETEGGCGTTEFCRVCGAVNAILASLRGEGDVQECRIIRRDGSALDLMVWATPLLLNGQRFSIFAVKDIAGQKRRRILERIFFHDVLNTAGGLRGMAELMTGADGEELDELTEMIYGAANELIGEIQTQKLLMAAENSDLTLNPSVIDAQQILQEVKEAYKNHDVAEERFIQVSAVSEPIVLESDRTHLWRVIGNMVKNALEASEPGDAVTLGVEAGEDGVLFWVHNPTFMSREVQLQLFQRSFSTKGHDRGLGTYSIKLLSEQYLQGKVSFSSSRTQGTTFKAYYPFNLRIATPQVVEAQEDSAA